MPPVPPHIVHKHAEFFFPDGNIVLITGEDSTLGFRLHRGIVNRWSPIFRGMLDALDAASDPWTFLDCGVLVFDDDPVDFERLIRALCDGMYVQAISAVIFPQVILCLLHKGLPLIARQQTSRFWPVSSNSHTNMTFRTCKLIL